MRGPVEIVPGVHCLGSELANWYLVEDGGRLTPPSTQDCPASGATWRPTWRRSGSGSGARVMIHSDDEKALAKPGPKSGDASPGHLLTRMWNPRLWRFFGHMARRGGAHPPKIEGAETFADGDVLDVPGRPRVVHTPGHTPGHCALHFEPLAALFAGDLLYTQNPLTGRSGPQVGPSVFNVDTDRCFESLAAMEGLEARVVLVGHGEPWRGSPADAVARAREAGRS